ncbi:Membrane-bound lytic murein transglycosylase D precursor [compost metagenome]
MQDTRRSGRSTTVLAANTKKQTQYKVKQGDSLYMVAKRFNVEMQHLKRWNPRVGQALKPGQMLTVYQPH